MMHEALIFADDRPMSTSDDLYQWATDAETLIRQQHASLADAQAEIARLRGALEEINRTTFDDDANRIAHSALQK